MVDVAWPAGPDLAAWLGTPGLSAEASALVDELVAETSEWISERTCLPMFVDDVATKIPKPVRRSILLYSAKFYRRKDSPDGIAGQTQVGIIRTGRWDSDAESLLAIYLPAPHA